MYRSICRKPIGVTLIIMKKASGSGRKISVRQQGPLSVPSSTRTGLPSRDIKLRVHDEARRPPARLETACAKALSYTPNPSLKNITTILQNGQDKVKNATPPRTTDSYGLTRRAAREKGGVQA